MNILSTVVGSAIFFVSLLWFLPQMAKGSANVDEFRQKYLAELKAAELLELFRGVTSAALYARLGAPYNYPLCSHIGILDRATNTIVQPDPIAALLPTAFDGPDTLTSQFNRFYQVHLVDPSISLSPNTALCGQSPSTVPLGANRLLVSVGVSWISQSPAAGEVQQVVLTTLLPL